MSGQGWPDWEMTATALANVKRIMPDADVVTTYKLGGNPRLNIPSAVEPASIAGKYLTAEKFQEAWWGEFSASDPPPAWQQVVEQKTRLVICSHAVDVPRFDEAVNRIGCSVVHIPHGAEVSVFAEAAKPYDERETDVILTGSLSEAHYPLRCKFRDMIRNGTMPGNCRIFPHPGCWANSIEQAESRVRDYAEALGNSKIALVCSSRWRYPLAKYIESAMAGCLVVGDEPADPPAGFGDLFVPVAPETPPDAIAAMVAGILADGTEACKRAALAQRAAIHSFSQEDFAFRFVYAVAREILDERKRK